MPVTFRYELPEILKIPLLKSRVVLCAMKDVVVEDSGEMRLVRKGIRECWARIDERRGSLTGLNGLTLEEPQDRQSHIILTRYMWDIDVTSAAWIYERRLKSPPRWFKVLGVADSRLAYQFSVRQVERSDCSASPAAESNILDPKPRPKGFNL